MLEINILSRYLLKILILKSFIQGALTRVSTYEYVKKKFEHFNTPIFV